MKLGTNLVMWQARLGVDALNISGSRLDKWGDVASAFWHGFWMTSILCQKPVETMHTPLSPPPFWLHPRPKHKPALSALSDFTPTERKVLTAERYCIILFKSQTIRTGKANSNKDRFTKQLCKNRLVKSWTNKEEQGKSCQKKEEVGLNFTTKS